VAGDEHEAAASEGRVVDRRRQGQRLGGDGEQGVDDGVAGDEDASAATPSRRRWSAARAVGA
jgi:hypothetical protein